MNTLTHALIADVLASLENASGIPLGTAAYLQVQELVRQLPEDTQPEDLKTLLAPLLCRSQEEQEQFYEIFKKSWARVQETGELEPEVIAHVEAEIRVEKRKRRWGSVLWYILLIIIAIGAFILWRQSNPETPEWERIFRGVRVGESGRCAIKLYSPSEVFLNECARQDTVTSCVRWDSIGPVQSSDGKPGVYYANLHYTAFREGIDSFCLQLKSGAGSSSRRYTIIITVSDTLAAPLLPEEVDIPDTVLYQVRDIPYPRDLSVLDPPQPTAWQQFLSDYEWWLKMAFILLTGLLLWWLARRIEQKRRRPIAEHQPNVKPPYTWDISLGAEPEVGFGDDFYALLLQLRRRESDELWRLDVPRTVRATVDKGGMPDFRYAQQTRPAEYLLLIDRQSGRDHQARLFDLLYRNFRSQEVLVERYWYDEGDPRRCYNETHPNGLSLRDLHYYHPQSRVLLLGNAYALLHPGTGNLNKWVIQTFSAWTDRAILTTQPLSAFGRRERNLQELFHVLPASLSGLRDVIELFDADEGKTPDLNPRRFPDAAQEPIQLIDNDLIKTIQSAAPGGQMASDDEKFIIHHSSFIIWVSACAMYPELHWDLTLQLGHLIDGLVPSDGVASSHPVATPGPNKTAQSPLATNPTHDSRLTTHDSPLTTHNALQALCRLPWFSEGEMPLEVRKTLLAWLEREHLETHYRLREGLHKLLAQNPPPADSAAYDDYAMNLALNEWLYTRDQERKKELQREIAARLAAGQQADFMVLRMLDPGRSLTPEQFEVPEDWKKHLREKGYAFLNPRRAWWWAVPIWLVLCGLALWWQPERVGCEGLNAVFQNNEYCIENFEEWAVFREMVFLDTLPNNGEKAADSLFNITLKAGWENLVFFKKDNYFNEAIAKAAVKASASDSNISTIRLNLFHEAYKQEAVFFYSPSSDIDSVSFLQNAAVAYFNEGAKIHKAYSSMWEVVERSGQKPADANYRPRSEACAYFSRAQEINALLPDTLQLWYVRDAAKCDLPVVRESSNPPPQAVEDITINGQLNNAATKRPLYLNEWTATKIEARGMAPANLSRGAFFNIRVPGDRKSPVELNITSPGFEPLRMTIRPTDFGKYQNVELAPLQKCYELLRAQGIALMNEKKYEAAGGMFTAAAQCSDVPKTGNDLPGLMEQAGKLALSNTPPSGIFLQEYVVKQGETLLSVAAKFKVNVTELEQINLIGASEILVPGKRLLIPVKTEYEVPEKTDEQKRLDAERQANADDDGDGVPNKDDKCPTEKGSADNGGCPASPDKDLAAILAEIDANMVTVSGGTFQMGCDEKRDGICESDEQPVHPVQLTSFEMSKFEVTQKQWQAIMAENPSSFKGCDNCPVEQVSWNDVQGFLTKLNALSGKKYRLPTEAEWEYAARGGSKSRNFKYAGSNKLEEVGWYTNIGSDKTHPVGTKKANELGLYDMSGNVMEWCSDWFSEYYLGKITPVNPQGAEKGPSRVGRGGSWYDRALLCRVAYRNRGTPDSRVGDFGFRLVLATQ